MWYAIIFIIALLSFVYTSRGVNRTDGAINDANTIKASEKVAQKVLYSTDKIKAKLKKLKEKPLDKKDSIEFRSAMCYSPIGGDGIDLGELENQGVNHAVADSNKNLNIQSYICPNCGEKTIFKLEESNIFSYLMLKNLPELRKRIQKINGVEMRFDESQLCSKCRPKGLNSKPELFLKIKYQDDSVSTEIRSLGQDDIDFIEEFFNGDLEKKKYTNSQYLNNDIMRLERLLGIKTDK